MGKMRQLIGAYKSNAIKTQNSLCERPSVCVRVFGNSFPVLKSPSRVFVHALLHIAYSFAFSFRVAHPEYLHYNLFVSIISCSRRAVCIFLGKRAITTGQDAIKLFVARKICNNKCKSRFISPAFYAHTFLFQFAFCSSVARDRFNRIRKVKEAKLISHTRNGNGK